MFTVFVIIFYGLVLAMQFSAGQSTEVRFASFLSGGFTTMTVINPLERKLAKRISVHSHVSNLAYANSLSLHTFI